MRIMTAGMHGTLMDVDDFLRSQGHIASAAIKPSDADLIIMGVVVKMPSPAECSALIQHVDMCANTGKPMIILSSSLVYDSVTPAGASLEKSPIQESWKCMAPSSMDDATRGLCLSLICENIALQNRNCCVLRTFNVYGGEYTESSMDQMISAAGMGGVVIKNHLFSTRSYLFIDDFLSLINRAVNKRPYRGVFNVGNDEVVTLDDVIGILSRVSGKQLVRIEGEHTNNGVFKVPDITRVKANFGWQPQTSVALGIKMAMDRKNAKHYKGVSEPYVS